MTWWSLAQEKRGDERRGDRFPKLCSHLPDKFLQLHFKYQNTFLYPVVSHFALVFERKDSVFIDKN